MYKEYKINNLEDTKKLAEEIADKINLGEVITLKGTLGAGKTFFTNCFINYLMKKNNLQEVEVASPTFNIVKEYQLNDYSIYHFDLYRLKNKNELYELDIENCFENGITLIEWPEIAEDIIYNIAIEIEICIQPNNSRIFKVNYLK